MTNMKKEYLYSEDKYSGQVVIVCESEEIEQQELLNSEQVQYLYDEPLYRTYMATCYTVKIYYHYEDVENRENNLLADWYTYDKKEANQLFKDALVFVK